MFALLPIHKPRGVNSRRVVDLVERLVPGKVGHAGTLDPLASGVLLTAIGPATRLVPYAQQLAKRYIARFQLGVASDSDDMERECRPIAIDSIPDRELLDRVVAGFVGEINQVPPRFSAVKVGGQRAYRRAQRGLDCPFRPKRITIHSIRLSAYEFPFFELDVVCGRGTYLRSLGRDIAAQLGTQCVMMELCRQSVGPFDLSRCAALDDVRIGNIASRLCDPREVLVGIPTVRLEADGIHWLSLGRTLELSRTAEDPELVAIDLEGRLQAILRPAQDGSWRPALNFVHYWLGAESAAARV